MDLVELLQIASSEEKNGKVYINGIEGFWSYAKERLLKFHGVSKDNFIYYLKELEFRYNFRDNIDDNLYKCLGGINWGIT
jgi:transposase